MPKTHQVNNAHRVPEGLCLAVLIVTSRLRFEGDDARLIDIHGEVSATLGVRVARAKLVALGLLNIGVVRRALIAAEALHSVLHSGI